MSGSRARSGVSAAILAAVSLSACGGGARQDVSEPRGNFPVAVQAARFPASQRLSQHSHLVIKVRNAGNKAIPDIAVTITDPATGTSAQAFGELIGSSEQLASHSRPVWIIDQAPGPCGYSCGAGGPGGGVTAYSNTWALGSLAPGRTATFDWALTAVRPGTHTVQYQIAAGLNGKARAILQGGGSPVGRFRVIVHDQPSQAYVNAQGQVVTSR
ncbi:MAG: hypothetical protein ACYC91_07745 [Solirubrobacteraceae bacterium]